jgi:hypothetical protein
VTRKATTPKRGKPARSPRARRPRKQPGATGETDAQALDRARGVVHTAMRFWMVCAEQACKRARACRGDTAACRDRIWPQLPEQMKVYFRAAIAARGEGRSAADAARAGDEAVAQWRAFEARMAQPAADATDAGAAPAEAAPSRTIERNHAAPGPRVRLT